MTAAAVFIALAAAWLAVHRRRPRRGAYRLIIALRPLAVATTEED